MNVTAAARIGIKIFTGAAKTTTLGAGAAVLVALTAAVYKVAAQLKDGDWRFRVAQTAGLPFAVALSAGCSVRTAVGASGYEAMGAYPAAMLVISVIGSQLGIVLAKNCARCKKRNVKIFKRDVKILDYAASALFIAGLTGLSAFAAGTGKVGSLLFACCPTIGPLYRAYILASAKEKKSQESLVRFPRYRLIYPA